MPEALRDGPAFGCSYRNEVNLFTFKVESTALSLSPSLSFSIELYWPWTSQSCSHTPGDFPPAMAQSIFPSVCKCSPTPHRKCPHRKCRSTVRSLIVGTRLNPDAQQTRHLVHSVALPDCALDGCALWGGLLFAPVSWELVLN